MLSSSKIAWNVEFFLGKENVQKYGLKLQNDGYFSDYNLKVEPNVLNSFAAAAGLFFYSMLPNSVSLYSKEGTKTAERFLADLFYNPGTLYFQDRLDSLIRYFSEANYKYSILNSFAYIRYLIKERSDEVDIHFPDQLTSRFLKGSGNLGLDLGAMIIQMGRDHGLPSYSLFRAQCGLKKPTNFNDIREDLREPEIADDLQKLYK